MIPYDDLVAALTAWRARQGLPVATPVATPGSGPTGVLNNGSGSHTAMPGSGPVKAGSGPVRGGPPSAPPKGQSGGVSAYQPPPLAAPDDSLDVDDAALLEESAYDNEGADYGMSFGGVERDEESTTLGEAPQRDSFGGETELDPGSLSGKPKKPW